MAEGEPPFPLHEYCFVVTGNVEDDFRQFLEEEKEYIEAQGFSESLHPETWRKNSVKFIDKMIRAYISDYNNEFDAMVPYMAMTYYDRFTSKKMIPSVASTDHINKELFTLCCLSIAWKYHLLDNVPFKFTDFELQDPKAPPKYPKKEAVKMSLHICRQLDWKFETVTPFLIAEYLIPVLCLPPDSPSPRRSIRHLIVKSQAALTFTQHAPSVVAASAVLAVVSEMFPSEYNEMEAKMFSTFTLLSKEGVTQCRKLFSQLYKIKPQRTFTDVCDPLAGRPYISFGRVIGHPRISNNLFLTCLPPANKPKSEVVVTTETNVEGDGSTTLVVAKDEYVMNFKLGWSEVMKALGLWPPMD